MNQTWEVKLHCDIVRGVFSKEYKTSIYWEVYYVVASKKGYPSYIHNHFFVGDYDKAVRFVQRIKLTGDSFTPENKPNIWKEFRDQRPFDASRKYRPNWKNWFLYGRFAT